MVLFAAMYEEMIGNVVYVNCRNIRMLGSTQNSVMVRELLRTFCRADKLQCV